MRLIDRDEERPHRQVVEPEAEEHQRAQRIGAISPHMPTHLPAPFAAWTVSWIALSTAGCSGS